MAGSLAAPQVPQRHDAQFHLGCRCSILHVSIMGSLARHFFERKWTAELAIESTSNASHALANRLMNATLFRALATK